MHHLRLTGGGGGGAGGTDARVLRDVHDGAAGSSRGNDAQPTGARDSQWCSSHRLVLTLVVVGGKQIVRVRGPQDVTVELVASREELKAWKQREDASEHPELWLRHVKQFYSVVRRAAGRSSSSSGAADALDMSAKVAKLASLLSEVVFSQCMVFCNDKLRAEALATALAAQGWPAVCITGAQHQTTRSEVMEGFRAFRSRVLVSTDLTARGIDVDRVNFVVNLDLPRDPATYLHRVGRAGRFGGRGLAVTLLAAEDVVGVEMLARVFKMNIEELPDPVPRAVFEFVRESAASRSEDVGSAAAEMTIADRSETVGSASLAAETAALDRIEEPVGELEDLVSRHQVPAEETTEALVDAAVTSEGVTHVKPVRDRHEHKTSKPDDPEESEALVDRRVGAWRKRSPPTHLLEEEEASYERWLTLL